MATSFLLALREGIEAALIIGIVIGSIKKMGRYDLLPKAWAGVGISIILSVIAGFSLFALKVEFSGIGEQIFEGFTLLLAAIVLTWMIFWMAKTAPSMRTDLEDKTKNAINGNGIFFVAFIAVFREGIELALFLAAISTGTKPIESMIGSTFGILTATILGWLLFNSTIRLNLQQFFKVTNVMLIIMAAGMVGLGIHELNEIGIIPAVVDPIWNLNWLVQGDSILGQLLQALIGYHATPSLTEAIGYGTFLFCILILTFRKPQTQN